MKNLLPLFSLFISSLSLAQDIIISDVKIRPALQASHPTTIYLNIENISDQLDYLSEVKIIGYPDAIASINKTVIEKNVARVIHIDRLAIPPHSKISFAPGGIYIIATNLSAIKELTLQVTFKHHGKIYSKYFEKRDDIPRAK